jgi:capsular exopolysaccharide synthesis family protein
VASTQLITITAESSSPRRAQAIATAYAALTVRYAPTLQPQTKASVSQASPAALPTSPSQPKPLLYGLAAALLGLAAGIAFAFARERFDVRLRSVDDIASHLGLPILADIPLRTSNPRSISQFAEGFKLLRTNLQFLDQTMSTRTIAITSWNEGEGKTTVTSQLAISLATSGTATLAVDGDIYRPGLHAALTDGRADSEVPGFSDYLADSTPIEELALETRIETLAILPAGSRVSGLSTLLNSRAGRAAIAKLSNRFDAGVIDCPPLVAGADAPALAARADGVILVVDLSRASKTSLDAAKQRLEAVNAVILGVAVNRDRSRSDGSYYYYRDENGARPWRNRLGTRARDLIR